MILSIDTEYRPEIPRAIIISESRLRHLTGFSQSLSLEIPNHAKILRAAKKSKSGFHFQILELQEAARQYIKNSRWQKPCQAMFDHLAQKDVEVLVGIIFSEILKPSELTFAAESLGQAEQTQKTHALLVELLEHPSPVVREGAIYGFSHFRPIQSDDQEHLLRLAQHDPYEGVREAARELLEVE